MSDEESRAIFREEALDLLAELDSTLLELESSPHDMDLVNQVFRALHTIKGSGSMFGFDDIADFTHALESVFDKVRNEELIVTRELVSTSFAARDHILGLLNGVDEYGNGSPEKGLSIQADARALMAGKPLVPVFMQADALVQPGNLEIGEEPRDTSEDVSAESALNKPDFAEPVTYRIRFRPREPKVDKDLHLDPLFEGLRSLGQCTVQLNEQALPELNKLE